MEIQILYFDGCPTWQNALENLQTALRIERIDTSINMKEVKSDQETTEVKFLGSPSFQLNGEDFWPESRQSYAMTCRIYRTSEGLRGWPTVEMLRQKLLELRNTKELEK